VESSQISNGMLKIRVSVMELGRFTADTQTVTQPRLQRPDDDQLSSTLQAEAMKLSGW